MKKILSNDCWVFNINILYIFAYLLYVTFALVNTTYVVDGAISSLLAKLVRYITFFLLIIYSFYKYRYRENMLIGAIVFGGLFFINALLNDFSLILMLLFVFLYPNNLSPRKLGKMLVKILIAVYFIILVLTELGWIFNYVEYRPLDGTVRHALGFVSPNACATYFLYILLIAVYCWKPKEWKLYIIIPCMVLSIVIFQITNSRMATIYEFLLFAFIIVEGKFEFSKVRGFFYPTICLTFVFMAFLSIMVIVYFSNNQNEWYIVLNQLFSSRLGYIIKFYNEYGISLWGNCIELHGLREATAKNVEWAGIDNSYVFILIKYGVIVFVMFFMGFVYTALELKKRNDYLGALYLIVICLIGLTENVMYNIAINYGIIIFASLISCNYSVKINKKGYL